MERTQNMGEMKNTKEILVGKLKEKTFWRRWEDNIRMNLEETYTAY
jgi:hypothetical protein